MTNPVDSPQLLLRVEVAADKCSLSRSKFYELIGAGEIESVKIGRSTRVPVDAVEKFVARLRAGETTGSCGRDEPSPTRLTQRLGGRVTPPNRRAGQDHDENIKDFVECSGIH
jgi:excisionase family DNA binding protein